LCTSRHSDPIRSALTGIANAKLIHHIAAPMCHPPDDAMIVEDIPAVRKTFLAAEWPYTRCSLGV